MKDRRVCFMGTPDFAVPVLKKLIEETNVVLVVSQPDKLVGRHQVLEETPVKKCASNNDIEVFQPVKIREDYKRIIDVNPDIIVTCAYGQIIPKELLELPKFGCINVHASLLPKLRGGAPLHKAIIYGEKETGITIMYMDEKMDSGDIISQKSIPITMDDNVGTIHDKLSILGAKLLIEVLPSIFKGENDRIKQDESKVTYAYNVTREEEHIDFNKKAIDVYNQIRGLYPFPVAYTSLNGEIIKVTKCELSNNEEGKCGQIICANKTGLTVKCQDKSIKITRIKPSGKKEMDVKDFLNGYKEEILMKEFN